MSGDFVLDASALVLALVGRSGAAEELRARLPTIRRHAPHLIDAEVGNVLRRHERSGLISTEEAQLAVGIGHALIDHRYPHTGEMAQRAWRYRATISFYDALYVALAAGLGVPLLTADARLARAPGLDCRVEVL